MHKHLGVRFVYDEQSAVSETHAIGQNILTSTALSALPEELRIDLQHTVERIDLDMTNRNIERIRQYNAPLADGLSELVKNYRFDTLQALLEQEDPKILT